MMSRNSLPLAPSRQFTGRHLLALMLAFFGIVISVNLTMAFFARSSWTGLVVENSYVASQEFNGRVAEARAQAALGWRSRIEFGGGRVTYAITDPSGRAVPLRSGILKLHRPFDDAEDATIVLTDQVAGSLAASYAVRDGVWIAEIVVDAGRKLPYREVRRILLQAGAMR